MEERSMDQECSSVVIPIILLNFRTRDAGRREEGGEGRKKRTREKMLLHIRKKTQ